MASQDIIPVGNEDNPLAVAEHEFATNNPAMIYIASLSSEHSRRTMRDALNIIAAIASNDMVDLSTFPWHRLRYEHTITIRTLLIERYQPATVNKMLSALRRVLKEAWRLGYMSAEDYQRASDLSNIRNHTLPAGRNINDNEVTLLLQVCRQDDSPRGARDAAILAVLYTGLRRAEIAALTLADLEPGSGKLRVRGKGRKERTMYLDAGSMKAMQAWLAVRGAAPGALFMPTNKRNDLVNRHLTDQTIYDILRRRREEADTDPLTPHDFRRTAIGDLLDEGVDIATVAKLMGHADVKTTGRYDRRDERVKQEAAQKRNLPSDEAPSNDA